jgi:hypothetical protein
MVQGLRFKRKIPCALCLVPLNNLLGFNNALLNTGVSKLLKKEHPHAIKREKSDYHW